MTAASLLEPVYIRRSAWKSWWGSTACDSSTAKIRTASDLDQADRAGLQEQIEDLDEAFNWYGRVFQEKATERTALEQLLRLAPKLAAGVTWANCSTSSSTMSLSNPTRCWRWCAWLSESTIRSWAIGDAARRHYGATSSPPGNRTAAELFEEAFGALGGVDRVARLARRAGAHGRVARGARRSLASQCPHQ